MEKRTASVRADGLWMELSRNDIQETIEPDNSNSFSLPLNLSSTPELTITKSVKESGEEKQKKGYKKER